MEDVAVVILNYNGRAFLEQFLPTVLACSGHHTVYVADNASTDESVSLLQSFPTVRLIRLKVNAGYAGGYNAALSQIQARYFLLLNSDVEVTPGWIESLYQFMELHPEAGACQPKVRSWHRRTHFEYAGAAGGYLDWLGYAFCRGRLFDTVEEDRGQYDDARPVFWATGACLLVRSAIFRQLGGFDADFFAHMEEIDLCWRMHRLGHQVWYCPGSTVYHVGGGTLPQTSPRKTFLNYRNSLAMLYKNLPGSQRGAVLLVRLILDGASALPYLFRGRFQNIWAIIRAHFAFYRWLPKLRRERRNQERASAKVVLYPRSIVWQYFVRGRKTYAELKR